MALQARLKSKFPARVIGGTGITVAQSGATYTFGFNWGTSLSSISSIALADRDNLFVTTYNSASATYEKASLDVFFANVAFKEPARAATTANITLSGEQTIDGVAVIAGDRVLVKDQSTGADNGIYVAATGAWTRATDFDGANDVTSGTQIFVTEGTTNGGTTLYVSTANPISIGSTSITFSVLSASLADNSVTYAKMQDVSAASRILGRGSAAGSGDVEELTAGGGLVVSTATIAVGAGTGITVNADDVALASIATARFLANFSGSAAAPTATSFNTALDSVFGSARGTIIVRGASSWDILPVGSANTFIKSDGTDPAYAALGNLNLVSGFTATSFSNGTKTTGTFTPDPLSGNIQHYTNGGAHTLAPPTNPCTIILECTNASAGALTTSGFSIVSGDTYSATGTKKHVFYITKTNSFSSLHVQYVTGT